MIDECIARNDIDSYISLEKSLETNNEYAPYIDHWNVQRSRQLLQYKIQQYEKQCAQLIETIDKCIKRGDIDSAILLERSLEEYVPYIDNEKVRVARKKLEDWIGGYQIKITQLKKTITECIAKGDLDSAQKLKNSLETGDEYAPYVNHKEIQLVKTRLDDFIEKEVEKDKERAKDFQRRFDNAKDDLNKTYVSNALRSETLRSLKSLAKTPSEKKQVEELEKKIPRR